MRAQYFRCSQCFLLRTHDNNFNLSKTVFLFLFLFFCSSFVLFALLCSLCLFALFQLFSLCFVFVLYYFTISNFKFPISNGATQRLLETQHSIDGWIGKYNSRYASIVCKNAVAATRNSSDSIYASIPRGISEYCDVFSFFFFLISKTMKYYLKIDMFNVVCCLLMFVCLCVVFDTR